MISGSFDFVHGDLVIALYHIDLNAAAHDVYKGRALLEREAILSLKFVFDYLLEQYLAYLLSDGGIEAVIDLELCSLLVLGFYE